MGSADDRRFEVLRAIVADFVAVPNARFSAPRPAGDVQVSMVSQRIGANYFAAAGYDPD